MNYRHHNLLKILVLAITVLTNDTYAENKHYEANSKTPEQNNVKSIERNREIKHNLIDSDEGMDNPLVKETDEIKMFVKMPSHDNKIRSDAKKGTLAAHANDKVYLKNKNIDAQNYETKPTENFSIDVRIRNDQKRRKRSIEENDAVVNKNMTKGINSTKEVCIGAKEYCDLTREEYVQMMKNYIYPQTYEWVLIATYIVVFIGGLLGNALVCVAVYRNHSMRTVTNYFIVNLAVADFMVILFCLPPTLLWDVTETWFFGAAMCKIILYFQAVSVTVSVLTLTFISVDRWYAICFPLRFKSTTGRAKLAVMVIWTVSLTLNAPELVVLTTAQSVPLRFELEYLVQCVATWSLQSDLIWHIIKVVFIYTIPLLLMTAAYYQIVKVLWRSEKIPGQADTAKLAPAERSQLRSRRKAAKMLAAVVIMFGVCYFPVHLLSMLRYTLDIEQNDAITLLALISHVLCYANSAINPLIYNLMNGKFRTEFRRAFCCAGPSARENLTTLSRLTTYRKKPCELVALEKRSGHGYNYQTTQF